MCAFAELSEGTVQMQVHCGEKGGHEEECHCHAHGQS